MTERYDIKILLQMICIFSFIAGLHIYAREKTPAEIIQTETVKETEIVEESTVAG